MRHHPATAAVHALLATACLFPALRAEESAFPPGDARLRGGIAEAPPDPSPPPPAVLAIAARDVLESKTATAGGRQVTTERIVPLELPPVPEPASPPGALAPEAAARFRELNGKRPAPTYLFLGATTYHSRSLPGPRTLLRGRDPETGASFACWSAVDWSPLEGVGDFQDETGRRYHLLSSHVRIDIDRWREFTAGRGTAWRPPVIPDLPEGGEGFTVTEGELSGVARDAVTALHGILERDHAALLAARAKREQARLDREEALRLHPPRTKNLVIRHWRMDAAGRQGLTPKPATAR